MTATVDRPVSRPPRAYVIGKSRPNAILGRNRETGELLVLLGGGALGLICGLALPWLPLRIFALFGFPLLACALVFLPYRKRTIYQWFEIDRTYRRLQRTDTARWRSKAAEAGTRLDGTEVDIAPPPGIGRIRWLRASFVHAGVEDQLAVLLHLDRRWVTATLEIEGAGVGCRDAEDQEALVARLGTLLQHIGNGDGFVTRLQMIARTLPADPDAHARDVTARGEPGSPEWLQASYQQLQTLVSTSSEQHRAYLTAAIPYTRELAAEALSVGEGSGDRGLARVAVRELSDLAARLADADITVRRPISAGAMAALVHAMYDPDHPIDRLLGMTPRHAWPAELDATAPTYLAAKTFESDTAEPWCHATAWIKEWPLTPVGVNFLAPLLVHTPDVIRTVAVVMDLEPTDVAIHRMLTEKTNDDAESNRTARMGHVADPRDRAHSGRIDQRGDDLASGAAGVNLVGYLTVSARTPEALARDKRTIRAAAGKCYLHLQWCDREHHRAFVNTLPFAAGIRR